MRPWQRGGFGVFDSCAMGTGNLTRPNHDPAPVVDLYRLMAPVNCGFAK